MTLDFKYESNRIFAEDSNGKLLAEITFPTIQDGLVDLSYVFVDPSLRGQGIADQIVRAAIAEIRKRGVKAIATCPYVRGWFDRQPDESDVLEQLER